MLTESDDRWLRDSYPGLVAAGHAVTGRIEYRASYDPEVNRFCILSNHTQAEADGLTLEGAFEIRIEERSDKSDSRLPALYVEGIDPVPDRHFNQRDNSACLCSPFDEDEFLQPEFQFRRYLEQLVIPFLYGQTFYSSHDHWPWAEYEHGSTGILEAYASISDENRAEECLSKLARDVSWPRVKSALAQDPHVKGHTPCFCPAMDQIRRCHPKALAGALRLQQHLRARGINVP
jgi:hypothetical protein